MEILSLIFLIIKNWWWFFLSIILFFLARYFYLWWARWEVWYKKNKWILLEIKPPEEILKPFKAMEDVIHTLWGIYDSANWRERWCEGQLPSAPYWFSFEVASFGGKVHFYLRILKEWRNTFESAIYSYYPETEITEVEDYTKNIPQDIPNKDWDLYGEDFTLMKDDVYPIRTYPMFFEERPDMPKEEKRMDPMNSLLEALSKLQSGEQLWFQIVAAPITGEGWVTRGEETANKIAKRPEKRKESIWQDVSGFLIETTVSLISKMGDFLFREKPVEEEEIPGEVPKEEIGLIAPELRLTPGEKEILKGVENKISKQGFKTWIRILYLYKINEPHLFGNYKIVRSYLDHFMTENLNTLLFMAPTRTRIHYWLRDRRLYLRKRQQFRNYVERLPVYFPWNLDGKFPTLLDLLTLGRYPKGPGTWQKGTFVLNAEELATIFHFPSKIIVSTVPRVEAKKGGPPPGLPAE